MSEAWVKKRLADVCDLQRTSSRKQLDENGKYILINSKFISSNGTSFREQTMPISFEKRRYVMVMRMSHSEKALAKCFW